MIRGRKKKLKNIPYFLSLKKYYISTVCCCNVHQIQKQHHLPVDQVMGNTFLYIWLNPEPFESQPNHSLHCNPLASLREVQPFRMTNDSTAIFSILCSFLDDPTIRFPHVFSRSRTE